MAEYAYVITVQEPERTYRSASAAEAKANKIKDLIEAKFPGLKIEVSVSGM